MASNWTKVEHETPEKPEIFQIAARLDMDPDEVFGKCFRVWRWFDQNTVDGDARGVTFALLDRHLCYAGFSAAMAEAGWLTITDNGIRCVGFDRHMGQSAKRRALTARRMQKARSKCDAECDADSVTPSLSLSYSSKQENNVSVPAKLMGGRFEKLWPKWLDHVKHKTGQAMSEQCQQATLMECMRRGEEKAVRDLQFSMRVNAGTLRDSDNDYDKPARKLTVQEVYGD